MPEVESLDPDVTAQASYLNRARIAVRENQIRDYGFTLSTEDFQAA